MKRISDKKLKQLGGRVPFSTARKSGKPKPKKRKPSEFKRIYGSRERVEWVKRQPCVACGVVGYSENAHIETGGMGRKADYTKIVPLCGPHQHPMLSGGSQTYAYEGCHRALHRVGLNFFERTRSIHLGLLAIEIQKQWERHSSGGRAA